MVYKSGIILLEKESREQSWNVWAKLIWIPLGSYIKWINVTLKVVVLPHGCFADLVDYNSGEISVQEMKVSNNISVFILFKTTIRLIINFPNK